MVHVCVDLIGYMLEKLYYRSLYGWVQDRIIGRDPIL